MATSMDLEKRALRGNWYGATIEEAAASS